MKRVTALVFGSVQGVGYRASVHRRISRLNVTGYVRNLPDGSVELDIQGTDSDVDAALEIAREGSPFSSVDRIEAEKAPICDNGSEFIVKR